jgi:hypothetical protein
MITATAAVFKALFRSDNDGKRFATASLPTKSRSGFLVPDPPVTDAVIRYIVCR